MSARVENFRCLADVEVGFDQVTTLIGPNGVGKSTVLRALDWFFNGAELNADDLTAGAPEGSSLSVSLTFGDLSGADREAITSLGLDAPSNNWTVIRRWNDNTTTTCAEAASYPAFGKVRSIAGALDMRNAYKALQAGSPELALPNAPSQTAVREALRNWEAEHTEALTVGEVPIAHPFGFGASSAFSGLFDYVLVNADLRAEEESADSRGSLIGRILAHRIDRGPAAAAFAELAADASTRHDKIVGEHLDPFLQDLAHALSSDLGEFTRSRKIRLQGSAPAMAPVKPTISLSIDADGTQTTVDRQGHGFRRALLIALLRFLAASADQSDHTVVMAIEEPELFQHPSQARVFARILRELGENGGYQIAYATHSPYFIEPRFFDQVRRLTRQHDARTGVSDIAVHQVSLDHVVSELDGLIKVEGIKSRWAPTCSDNLAEALFAEAVIVVEGTGDVGILEGLARRDGGTPLEDSGIVVADAHGKDGLLTPVAILRGLGIPLIAVYDTDRGLAARKAHKGDQYVQAAVASNATTNTAILTYFGVPVADPLVAGHIGATLFAIDDEIERVMDGWPEWQAHRLALIMSGRGSPGKNAATYCRAASEAPGNPPPILIEIVAAARALVAPCPPPITRVEG